MLLIVKHSYSNTEWSSPTTEFFSLKHVCGIISKEGRDVASVGIPDFLLQPKIGDEELLLLKETGAVDSFLEE